MNDRTRESTGWAFWWLHECRIRRFLAPIVLLSPGSPFTFHIPPFVFPSPDAPVPEGILVETEVVAEFMDIGSGDLFHEGFLLGAGSA